MVHLAGSDEYPIVVRCPRMVTCRLPLADGVVRPGTRVSFMSSAVHSASGLGLTALRFGRSAPMLGCVSGVAATVVAALPRVETGSVATFEDRASDVTIRDTSERGTVFGPPLGAVAGPPLNAVVA